MLYYLFDITVTIEANETRETYTDAFLARYPDDTAREVVEADAQDIMDKTADHYGDVFCRTHPYTEVDVQTNLNAYQLTEEEYNHLLAEYKDGE